MIIDELSQTINDESYDERGTESENDNNSIIIQSTNNASFATIIQSDNNDCTIKLKKNLIMILIFHMMHLQNLYAMNLKGTKLSSALNITE